jgi:hypothetical protein
MNKRQDIRNDGNEQMVTNMERRTKTYGLILLLLVTLVVLYNAFFSFSYSVGPNYKNVSVDTRVNITNARPEILGVKVDTPVTLNAGLTQTVTCNVSVRDWNGADTIANVTGVYWDNQTVNFTSPDDNNNHYTNLSCQNTSISGIYGNWTCNFSVYYYANNGTNWMCNVTVTDSYVFNESVGSTTSRYNTSTINALLALNVTPLIDYGNMAVGDTSNSQTANVTNFGNQNINISVKGYGNRSNDGLAFVCAVGNITIDNEKFGLNATGDFLNDFVSLNTSFKQIGNLTMPQQQNDSQQVINSTFWRLYVPPNPFGQCNGTVVFQAEAS